MLIKPSLQAVYCNLDVRLNLESSPHDQCGWSGTGGTAPAYPRHRSLQQRGVGQGSQQPLQPQGINSQQVGAEPHKVQQVALQEHLGAPFSELVGSMQICETAAVKRHGLCAHAACATQRTHSHSQLAY